MKILYRTLANTVFVVHFFVVLLVIFGWAFPQIWALYMAALVVTFVSGLYFGYCLLSKWEYDLWRLVDPTTEYDFTWATHYTHKLTNKRIPRRLYEIFSFLFMSGSISLNLVLKFV